jgi:hypothetical protein
MNISSFELLGLPSSLSPYIDTKVPDGNYSINFDVNRRFHLFDIRRRRTGGKEMRLDCFDVTIRVTPFRGLTIVAGECSLPGRFTFLLLYLRL